MNKKILVAFTVFFIALAVNTVKVKADDNRILGEFNNIVIAKDRYNYYYLIYCDSCQSEYYNYQYRLYVANTIEISFNSYQSAVDYCLNNLTTTRGLDAYTSYRYYVTLYVLKGSVSGTLAPDTQYLDIPEFNPPDPQWYEIVWDTFKDYMTNPVLGQWIDNLIARLWSDDNEGTIAENVDINAPTLVPTPTPIPYSTIVVPKTDIITGETVYETNYYYKNPDGTPTVAPHPPSNPPSNNGGGNGNSYTPVNGEPYSIPRLNWLTTVNIGENNYDGIDSIYEGIGSVNNIGSEYTGGLSAAQDATGTLPDSWLLLIGVAAAIPLISGIISRFLS